MRYIILTTLIFSSSAFSFDSAYGDKNAHIDCFKTSKKVHLSQARSKISLSLEAKRITIIVLIYQKK